MSNGLEGLAAREAQCESRGSVGHWRAEASAAWGRVLESGYPKVKPFQIRRITRCERCAYWRWLDLPVGALREVPLYQCDGPQTRGQADVPQWPTRGCESWARQEGLEADLLVFEAPRGRIYLGPEALQAGLIVACFVLGLDMPREEDLRWCLGE